MTTTTMTTKATAPHFVRSLQSLCIRSIAPNIERHPPECFDCLSQQLWGQILQQRVSDRAAIMTKSNSKLKIPPLSVSVLLEVEQTNEHLIGTPTSEVCWRAIVDYKHNNREAMFAVPFKNLCKTVTKSTKNAELDVNYLRNLPVSALLLKDTNIGKKLANYCKQNKSDSTAKTLLEKWKLQIEAQRSATNDDDNKFEDPRIALTRCDNWRNLFFVYSEFTNTKKEITVSKMKKAREGIDDKRASIASLDPKTSRKFSKKRARQEQILAGKSDPRTQKRLQRTFIDDDTSVRRKNNFLAIRQLAKKDYGRRMRADPTFKKRSSNSSSSNGNGNGNSNSGNSAPIPAPVSLSTFINKTKTKKPTNHSISNLKETGVIKLKNDMKLVVPNKNGVFYQRRFEKQLQGNKPQQRK